MLLTPDRHVPVAFTGRNDMDIAKKSKGDVKVQPRFTPMNLKTGPAGMGKGRVP